MKAINAALLGALGGAVTVAAVVYIVDPAGSLTFPFTVADVATLVSGFGGAIAGAIVAAKVSIHLAEQASIENARREEEARLALSHSQTLSVLLKIEEILNGLYTQKMYFWECFRTANERKQIHLPLWAIVRQQAGGATQTPTFSAEDFVPLMIAKKSELIQECRLIERRYAVIEKSLEIYGSKRESLQELLEAHSEATSESQILTTIADEEVARRAQIQINALQFLITDIYTKIKIDLAHAQTLADELSEAVSQILGERALINLRRVDDDTTA
ncbi:hypothetical protein [Rhizobium sp. AAP116]|uniref:hypothetical protein n=1 Tax=Rhizobium sp. AAP116 TaxID=1523429 RepID=UPI0012E2B929|nr:hypothetical protein [Rhizobium sp. AAP116]